ncbi:MAG: cyclic nucleotide-binding domain-containing protein [Ardenticatenaceae bacterium]|nr:cyclic nucleotide-binding domain-containing protein [Ardenticatenaceae bacterium]
MAESDTPSKVMAEQLANTQLSGALDLTIVRVIARGSEPLRLAAGEWLFRQGDMSDALYVVLSGELEAVLMIEGKGEMVVGEIGPSGIIGEMQILSGRPRAASIRAVTDASLAKISKEAFENIARAQPQFLARMGTIIEERLRRNQLFEALPKLFGPMDLETMRQIQARLEWVFLPRGEALMRQGEQVREFYILINGRLVAKTKNASGEEKTVGDVIAGESIGETQILTNGESTVTIYAVRDSELVRFSQEEFDWLITTYPTVLRQISIGIANDLRRVIQGPGAEKRDRDMALDIVVMPVTPDVPLADFVEKLGAVLAKMGPTLVLDSERLDEFLAIPGISQIPKDDPENIRLVAWLNEQETRFKFTLYQTDGTDTPWTRRSLRQADHIVMVGWASGSPALGEIETAVLKQYNETISVPQSLVLLYRPGEEPRETRRWLEPRQVTHHQHFRVGETADFQRLARHLTGKQVGLVLGGGGARGYAHIGVIRAFAEAGVGIDIVGGTSMGSLIAGQFALGWDYDTMVQRSKEALPKSVLDYTLPVAALITGRNWTNMVRKLFGEVQIEDLWRDYFCISSNLTQAKAIVHDRGSLWQAVRTSTAIPGIIPPMNEHGDLLVDGGVLDNLPVAVMQRRNGDGPIIASDVSAPVDLHTTAEFGPYLSGWQLLWQRLNPFAKTPDIPSMGATIMRASLLSSAQALDAAKAMADIYLYPPVEKFGTLEFLALEAIVEIGYVHAQKMIEKWRSEGKLDIFFAD